MTLFENLNLIPKNKSDIIKGAGIDPDEYPQLPCPSFQKDGLKFAFIGRLIKDKGVDQIVEAHQLLWNQGLKSQLWIIGNIDKNNPTSYMQEEVRGWSKKPGILCLGHKESIKDIWTHCHIALLMSKREGLPKSLLEAASSGRAIIASDVPGCREIVRNNYNGYLVPFGNVNGLAEAMKQFCLDEQKILNMGQASRQLILDNFTADKIANETMNLYKKSLKAI